MLRAGMGLFMGAVLHPSFRGASAASEPGIHNPSVAEYGFRVRRFAASRNDAE